MPCCLKVIRQRRTPGKASYPGLISPPEELKLIVAMVQQMAKIRSYMRGTPEELETIRERTRLGHYKLATGEVQWRDKAEYLLQRGYRLRPRLMPGWTPSWEGTDLIPEYCEDSVRAIVRAFLLRHSAQLTISQSLEAMDATRISDGMKVMIKRTSPLTSETAVLRFLNSPSLKADPSNHCVPIFDVFPDTSDSNIVFVVMPLLREFYEPPFGTVMEAIEFMKQTLMVSINPSFHHSLLTISYVYLFRELTSCTSLESLICSPFLLDSIA